MSDDKTVSNNKEEKEQKGRDDGYCSSNESDFDLQPNAFLQSCPHLDSLHESANICDPSLWHCRGKFLVNFKIFSKIKLLYFRVLHDGIRLGMLQRTAVIFLYDFTYLLGIFRSAYHVVTLDVAGKSRSASNHFEFQLILALNS